MPAKNVKTTKKDTLTKQVYVSVLDELLAERELSDISTSEIIDRSEMSRATFYKYFADKYELANWRYTVFLDTLAREYMSPDDAADSLNRIVHFIHDHRQTFKKLFRYTGQNSFNDYYMKYAFGVARDIASQSGRTLGIKERYVIAYHSAGILYILNEWVQSDDPLTPDEISVIIEENRSEMVKEIYVAKA